LPRFCRRNLLGVAIGSFLGQPKRPQACGFRGLEPRVPLRASYVLACGRLHLELLLGKIEVARPWASPGRPHCFYKLIGAHSAGAKDFLINRPDSEFYNCAPIAVVQNKNSESAGFQREDLLGIPNSVKSLPGFCAGAIVRVRAQ